MVCTRFHCANYPKPSASRNTLIDWSYEPNLNIAC